MRKIMLLIISLGLTTSAFAKAYFADKQEMIEKSDVIAIADVIDVVNLEKDKQYGNQRATASLVRTIKGKPEKEFTFLVPCFFPCAVTSIEKGRYLLFLRNEESGLVGCNWYFSYRPITKNKIEWYRDDTINISGRFETKELKRVIKEIIEIMRGRNRAKGLDLKIRNK